MAAAVSATLAVVSEVRIVTVGSLASIIGEVILLVAVATVFCNHGRDKSSSNTISHGVSTVMRRKQIEEI